MSLCRRCNKARAPIEQLCSDQVSVGVEGEGSVRTAIEFDIEMIVGLNRLPVERRNVITVGAPLPEQSRWFGRELLPTDLSNLQREVSCWVGRTEDANPSRLGGVSPRPRRK